MAKRKLSRRQADKKSQRANLPVRLGTLKSDRLSRQLLSLNFQAVLIKGPRAFIMSVFRICNLMSNSYQG